MPLTYEMWHTSMNTRCEAYILEDQSELVKTHGSYCVSETFKKSLIPITTMVSVMHNYHNSSDTLMIYLHVPFIWSTNWKSLEMVPKSQEFFLELWYQSLLLDGLWFTNPCWLLFVSRSDIIKKYTNDCAKGSWLQYSRWSFVWLTCLSGGVSGSLWKLAHLGVSLFQNVMRKPVPLVAQFHVPPCFFEDVSVLEGACVSVGGLAKRFFPRSGVDAEGQQLVRVQVVERAKVRQAQEEFGEEGGVVGAVATDERP